MAGNLVANITQLLGKAYVLAGLVPSALVVAAWLWLFHGPESVLTTLAGALDPNDDSDNILLAVFSWLGIAALFLAMRQPLFTFFQGMPGRLLAPLRHCAISYQLKRRIRAEKDHYGLLWKITVLNRFIEGNTVQANDTPAWFPEISVPAALSNSKRARDRVQRILSKRMYISGSLSYFRGYLLARNIVRFFAAYDRTPTDELERERKEWDTLLERSDVPRLLQDAANHIQRDWVAVRSHFRSFPDPLWMHPTAFGNRLAAIDDYAERRYKIDTATLWERLWWTLSDAHKNEIKDSKLGIEVMINMCTAFFVIALTSFIVLLADLCALPNATGSPFEWSTVITLLATSMLAFLSYRGALYAVAILHNKVVSSVDMTRLEVLTRYGYRPKTVGKELEYLEELRHFFTQETPRNPRRPIVYESD